MKKDSLGKCPKCGKVLANSRNKLKKDVNSLSLALLFGKVSLRKNKRGSCDLCGNRMRR